MKSPFLIGQAIYLRPLERDDAPLGAAWINHPEVNRTLTRHRPVSLLSEERYIEQVTRGDRDVVLVIVARETDRPVGMTGLHQIDPKNRHAAFGLVVGEPEEWGKGYGTEATRLMVRYAFETLNLNRVWLHVFENNARGLRAYAKAGFRREGLLRQDNYREGRYWDTIVMGILRSEWEHPPAPPGPVSQPAALP